MVYVLVDRNSVFNKIKDGSYYGLKCKFKYFNNTSDVKLYLTINSYLDSLYDKSSYDSFVILCKNEFIRKNIRGSNLFFVSSYAELDILLCKFLLTGLHDDIFLKEFFSSLDYMGLQLLVSQENIENLDGALRIVALKKHYNNIAISYLQSKLRGSPNMIYDYINLEYNKRREDFLRICNNFSEEVLV